MSSTHALSKAVTVTVYTVERCYDYEGCSVERVFGTEAEADAYVAEQKERGQFADFEIKPWQVSLRVGVAEGTKSNGT